MALACPDCGASPPSLPSGGMTSPFMEELLPLGPSPVYLLFSVIAQQSANNVSPGRDLTHTNVPAVLNRKNLS